jgi:hypothetical protein
MPETDGLLERMRVASPCRASWEAMEGDERVRFCRECSLHVYNLSEMKRREAEALLVRAGGRLCARFYRRADGTVITKDCPRGLGELRRRVARRAGAALAALLALAGGAFGQRQGKEGARREQGRQSCAGGATYEVKRGAASAAEPAFSGLVRDPSGAVVVGANVLVYDEGKKPKYGAATSGEGVFQIKTLPPGQYRVEIQGHGFNRFKLTKLSFGAGEAVRLELTLTAAEVTVTVGGVAYDPLTDTGPGIKRVFTRREIERLPY